MIRPRGIDLSISMALLFDAFASAEIKRMSKPRQDQNRNALESRCLRPRLKLQDRRLRALQRRDTSPSMLEGVSNEFDSDKAKGCRVVGIERKRVDSYVQGACAPTFGNIAFMSIIRPRK